MVASISWHWMVSKRRGADATVMDDEDGEEADQLPAVPQHATVQRPLNSSDVIVTRSHATDVC